jgi:beta-glucan synthesis-associated protein KRE6
VSSTNSVLGFTSDSKYAMPYVSYNPLSRAGIDSVAAPDVMYNLYDREDGPVDDDDYIHEPTAPNKKMDDTSWRGVFNVFGTFTAFPSRISTPYLTHPVLLFLLLSCYVVLVVVVIALITLFAGYPLITHFTRHREAWQAAITNGTGQVPSLPNLPSLIDPQTPSEFLTRTGFDGEEYELVFSDEFNTDGRSFYPGDDPFWEAVDLWVCMSAVHRWLVRQGAEYVVVA